MTENNNFAYESYAYNRRPRCPHCRAVSRLTHSLLDSRHGDMVHVYQCLACGRRIWDEVPGGRTRLQ